MVASETKELYVRMVIGVGCWCWTKGLEVPFGVRRRYSMVETYLGIVWIYFKQERYVDSTIFSTTAA